MAANDSLQLLMSAIALTPEFHISFILARMAAILSSHFDIAIDGKTCFAAEIGLSGEVRPVSRVEQRIHEAEKLGYKRIFISSYNGKETTAHRICVVRIAKIDELLPALFASN